MFSSVQSLSRVWLFVTPRTAARQASLSITNSRSILKLKSIKSVMPSNHLILCCPLLIPPSIFPNIRVFSNESWLWKVHSFFLFFYFTTLYWFCHTSTWICHGCTWVPNPEPPSLFPPHTISLGHPSAPAPSIKNIFFIIFLIFSFNCLLL